MYEVVDIPADAPVQFEQLGTKYKFWYLDEDDRRVLFKQGRPGTGEDWAEVVCSEICELLGLPHAHYEFAKWKDQYGVISPSFVVKGNRLVLGNEILAGVDGYEAEKTYRVKQHTVRLVLFVTGLERVQMPLGWEAPKGLEIASDVFVGYLMLDALVGNQDRHHENWGLIVGEQGLCLAPTFDHAASLGRNESDQVREERLNTRDQMRSVERYVERAKSALYKNPNSPKPLTTLAAFNEAARLRKEAAKYWLDKLSSISSADFDRIFSNIPDSIMSQKAKEFARKMLVVNTRRLLNSGV